MAFMVFEGKFRAPLFVEFLRRLLRQVEGKICLIVDGHPVCWRRPKTDPPLRDLPLQN
ncbi:hypothetical protein [Ramlibacter sp. WS9]|uniref:hypothetical protein n=1 Tax=Ramlibacter sp. WS9 TaxID=1882741 RepID=UPI003514620F